MSDKPKSKLVSVGSLYRESNKTRESQAALLARHGIEPEFTTRSGKGFAHWVTRENSEILRARMQEDADLQKKEKVKSAFVTKKIKTTRFGEDEITDADMKVYMITQVRLMIEVTKRLSEQVFAVSEKSKMFTELVVTQENMFVQMRSLYVEIAAISEELRNRSIQAP